MPAENLHNGNSRPSPADVARAHQRRASSNELDNRTPTPEDNHDEEGEKSPATRALEELVKENAALNEKIAGLTERLERLENEKKTHRLLSSEDIDAIIDRMNERHGKKSSADESAEPTEDSEAKDNPAEETLTLAEDQPRRVRNQGDVTERLVKYVDSKGEVVYKWRSPDGKETAADTAPSNTPDDSEERGSEAESELSLARHAYAEATAKRRGGVLGNLLTEPDNRIQHLPFVKKWAEKWNDRVDAKSLTPQREAYREATKAEQKKAYDAAIAELGDTEEGRNEARTRAIRAALQNDYLLEVEIASRRMENSGTASKFINWWVKGNPDSKLRTFFRRAGKAGILAAGGFAAGTLLAAGGVPLGIALTGGALAGGVIGGSIGNRVSKRRASGIEDVAENKRVADIQAAEDIASKQKEIDEFDKSKNYTEATDALISVTEGRTGLEEIDNRRRVGTGVGVGLAAGGAGVVAGAALRAGIENSMSQHIDHHHSDGGSKDGSDKHKDLYGKPPAPDKPHTPEAESIVGNSFNVEPGNGLTTELQQFAQANGHELTGDQAFQLHEALTNQFGQDYIDLAGRSQDVYSMGTGEYSTGIAAPGQASWDPGVADFVKNWMSGRGLW